MSNILIISGHPDLGQSVVNQAILAELADKLPTAQIRKLDALYPTYDIDVKAEQDALLWADTIVWQFPFSWYSLSGLMKVWLDKVFLHGFSHGSKRQLDGKKLIISVTCGAPAVAYQKDGAFGHGIDELLYQFEITAKLCGLDYQNPVITQGVSYSARDDEAKINAQKALAKDHADRLIAVLQG